MNGIRGGTATLAVALAVAVAADGDVDVDVDVDVETMCTLSHAFIDGAHVAIVVAMPIPAAEL